MAQFLGERSVGATGEDSAATGVDGDQTDNNAPGSGAVYIFTRSGEIWSQRAYLKGSNTDTESSDQFGHSVSLSGDTLAVGAIGENSAATGVNGDQTDNSLSGAGAVYVFVRSGETWSQQAYVKPSNTVFNGQFGYSVSLSEDTLAVGAALEGTSLTSEAGAVYVFVHNGGVWSEQASLKGSNTESGDRFGYSVSLSGDTLAVGATGEDSAATGVDGDQTDNNAPGSGAVYIFTRSDVTWNQQAYIKASNTGFGGQFGYSVSLFGEILAVGAIGDGSAATGINGDQTDSSLAAAGAVYIFTRSNGVWSQEVYVKASNPGFDNKFGHSVSLSEDILAAGAIGEDSTATGVNGDQSDGPSPTGAAYAFE